MKTWRGALAGKLMKTKANLRFALRIVLPLLVLSAGLAQAQISAPAGARPELVPVAARSTATSQTAMVATMPSVRVSTSDLNSTMVLSLNNVPLDQLVKWMADTTGKTIMRQKDINSQVSVSSPKPLTKRQALEMIYSYLQLDNIFVAEQDNMIMLINFTSIKNIRLENIPSTVDVQSLPDSLRIVQKVYKFASINAQDVRSHLEIFIPNTALTIEPNSNTLILTDQLTRIKNYDKIIKALDNSVKDKVIHIYKLTSSNAADLTQLLTGMISRGALASVAELTSGTQTQVVLRPQPGRSPQPEIVLIPEPRMNWIIALCPRDQKPQLDRLIDEFDVSKAQDHIVQIYKLKNTDAMQLIGLMNVIITNKGLGNMPPGGAAAMSTNLPMGGGRRMGMRRFMDSMASGGAGIGQGTMVGDILMIPETRLNWIIAILRPDLKDALDKMVGEFDVEKVREVQTRSIDLKGGNAMAVAATIMRLMGDQQQAAVPRDVIKVTPTDDNIKLIVISTEANYNLVKELAATVDSIPDDRVLDIYKLKYADAGELTNLLNNVISKSPMIKGGAAAAAQASYSGSAGSGGSGGGGGYSSGGSSYSRYSRFFGAFRGYGGGGSSYGGGGGLAGSAKAIQVGNIVLIPETRLNWIITICPRSNKADLDKLVAEFDIEKSKDMQARTIDVKHVEAQDIADALSSLLSQQAQSGRREAVRVSATQDNTRLIIWSTAANFKDIQGMVTELDVEKPKDMAPRMIEVKYADASSLAQTINTLFRNQYFTAGTKREFVSVSATDDGNRLMIMASESNHKLIEEVIKKMDVPNSESTTNKVFKIEHLEVQNLAEQLNLLYQNRNNSSGGYGGYGGYNPYGGYGGSRAATKPSFVSSPRNNTLVVMARPKDMPFVEEMIKQLDRPVDPNMFSPRVYHIRNTDAAEVVVVLQNLFSGRSANVRGQNTTIYNFDSSWRPNRTDNMDSVEAVFGKLNFVVDRVTNTIVALSSNAKNYEIVDKMIKQLDTPDPESSEVLVYDLKYADALKLANQLNLLFSEGTVQRSVQMTNGTGRSGTTGNGNNGNNNNNNNNNNSASDDTFSGLDAEAAQEFTPLWGTQPTARGANGQNTERPINTMIGNVRVVPDIRSNKLMIAAPAVYYNQLRDLIASLDHTQPQVAISTTILEITRGKELRVGMRWTPSPNSIEPGELDNAVTVLNALGYINTMGNSLTPVAYHSTIPNFSTSLKNGNTVISSNINIALLIQLLQKNTESRVLNKPSITVNNNETGNIFFGSEYPFRTSLQTTDNGATNVGTDYRPVGISLDIRPHINSDAQIVMKAAVGNSNVRAETIDGQLIEDIRRFNTEVSLKSGETMVIGGILIDDGQKLHRGVPVLGSIPVLKYIFGKSDDTQAMRELVFFVTPSVITGSEDVNRILKEKNKEIETISKMSGRNMEQLRQFEKTENPVTPEVPDEQPADNTAAPTDNTAAPMENTAVK